ncbi:unnamed protein product [Linum trigynum]|uniref:Uncharacterized protein n=1 Tax=Linum trigynum TaxID=586398 RepID=A0AAV2FNI5_9ROSI
MAVASGLSVLLFTIVIAVSLLGFNGHHREPVVMRCLFTAQMVACLWPIYSGYLVITTQTVNHISLFEISNGVLAKLAWLCYGIYRHNTLFIVPHAVMCVLLMLQVMIYESVANHVVNNPNPQALRDMIVRVTPVNEDV